MKRLGLVLAGALVACGGPLAEEGDEGAAAAPLAGVDGRVDSADRACHVVLRGAGRVSDGRGGYVTSGSSWVYEAVVDVSDAAIADGAAPGVLFLPPDGRTWREGVGTAIAGAGPGFQRFRFPLSRDLPGPGMSATSLSRARVELAPYIRLAQGGRAFDHNRHEDSFTNHVLSGSSGFAIADDASVCAARAPTTPVVPSADAPVIRFARGAITQTGAVLEAQDVVLDYDVARLSRCRNGSWDITARVRFQPSGRIVEGSIRSGRLVTRVPAGAVRIEAWFENTGGGSCRAWDSNDGRDHVFPVLRAPGWIGQPVTKISRATGHACSDGATLSSGFRFDTWARTRTVMTNVCFEVWQQGVTDWSNPEMWRSLDARLYYRYDSSSPFRFVHVDFVDRVGNNARFATSLGALDPFRNDHCPEGPVTAAGGAGGSPQYVTARMEMYFWVNGRTLTQASGAPFVGTFEDYPDNGWRAGNCP